MRMKKLLATLMAVMLVLTLIPTAAFADEDEGNAGGIPDESVLPEEDEGIAPLSTENEGEAETLESNGLPAAVNGVITLDRDYEVTTLETDMEYDLQGHTLTCNLSASIAVTNGETLTFKDTSVSGENRGGTLKLTVVGGSAYTSAINVRTNGTVNVSNITVECTCSAFYPQGDAAAVNITYCDVSAGCYCVATNAATRDNYGVAITLIGSTFTAENEDKDNCPVMINVEGTLEIEDCEITGQRQGVIVRAGTATIKNSTITTTGEYENAATQYHSGKWSSGNEVPASALTVGNYVDGAATSYTNDAVVTLVDTEVTSSGSVPAIYVDANQSYAAEVSISGDDTKVTGDVTTGQYTTTDSEDETDSQITIEVIGGEFDTDISEYIPAGAALTWDEETKKIVVDDTQEVVAEVNGVGYTTIQSAVDAAADGDTVVLKKDATAGDAENEKNFWINKSITLDLNGYTLTGAYQMAVGIDNANAEVTIKNGTLVGSSGYCVYIQAGDVTLDRVTVNYSVEMPVSLLSGNLVIQDSVICSTGTDQYGVMSFGDNNTVEIVNSTISADLFAVYHNGTYYGFEVTAKNSSITSKSAQAVYISGSTSTTEKNGGKNQQATFIGCTITGDSGIEGKYTDITLTDCTVTATGVPDFEQNNNGSTTSGFAVVSTDNSMTPAVPAPTATIAITSGSYVGIIGLSQLLEDENLKEATYEVSGGNFSAQVPEEYLDGVNTELYSTAVNKDAPYSYYESVSDAIAAATKAGDTDAVITVLTNDDTELLTVTLNANGGRVSVTTIKAKNGEEITLPAPTRGGYTFQGWYAGSTKVETAYTVTANVTLTAKWQEIPSTSKPSTSSRDDDDDGYAVSVPGSSSIKNGSITVSPRSAEKGDTVTITVKPDPGYELDELTVTAGGADVKLTQKSDAKYTFTMPASRVSVAVSFVRTGAADTRVFTDVPGGHWAEDEIAWAAENGYMNGNTATTFNPDGTVTRQQLWMILARLSGLRPADFAEAKDWAVQSGVTDGTAPGGAVTRQQLVTILYRWAKLMGRDVSGSADLTAYPDYASVASYAVDAMGWSVANGIVTGTAQGTLNPTGTATRAQFAVILYRFCEKTAG